MGEEVEVTTNICLLFSELCKKMQFSYTFLLKNLPVSAKISTFAADFE